jgi:flagellar biosynthesis protein FliR
MESSVLQFTLVLVRVASMVTFWPVFRRGFMPRTVRIGIVYGFTYLFLTGKSVTFADLSAPAYATVIGISLAIAREVLFGAGVGFLIGLVIEPARIAGAYIGQEMGLTLASVADPDLGPNNSIVTQIFEMTVVVLFLVLDGHHLLIYAMHASVRTIPIGAELFPTPLEAVPQLVDISEKWGLLIAAPVGICLFLSLITLTLLARSVPQLNVFSVGFAFRIGVGLVSLVIFSPAVLTIMGNVIKQGEQLLMFLKA